MVLCIHCPKNNLDLRIKAKPVTDGADATVYDRLLSHKLEHLLGLYAERQYIFWDSVFSSQKQIDYKKGSKRVLPREV